MKKVNINLQWEKEKIHTVMAEELDFPSYYGKNLDALYDALTDICEETVITVNGQSDYGTKLLAAINDAASANKNIKVEISGENKMTIEQAKEKLYALQAKLAAFNHATAVLYYDGATTAPKGTGANRAQTMAVLSGEIYKLSTGKDTVELLEFLDENKAQLEEKLKECNVILDIEPNGAFNVRRHRPDATLIFIMPPSVEELEKRLRGRGDTSADQITMRLERAKWEMEQSSKYNHIVINDTVDPCGEEILKIIAEKA